MSKAFRSYRELLADALSPKPSERNSDVLVVTNLQFKPSVASLRRAEEVRKRIRCDMAESTAESDHPPVVERTIAHRSH
jgi:hypothetical protein